MNVLAACLSVPERWSCLYGAILGPSILHGRQLVADFLVRTGEGDLRAARRFPLPVPVRPASAERSRRRRRIRTDPLPGRSPLFFSCAATPCTGYLEIELPDSFQIPNSQLLLFALRAPAARTSTKFPLPSNCASMWANLARSQPTCGSASSH